MLGAEEQIIRAVIVCADTIQLCGKVEAHGVLVCAVLRLCRNNDRGIFYDDLLHFSIEGFVKALHILFLELSDSEDENKDCHYRPGNIFDAARYGFRREAA